MLSTHVEVVRSAGAPIPPPCSPRTWRWSVPRAGRVGVRSVLSTHVEVVWCGKSGRRGGSSSMHSLSVQPLSLRPSVSGRRRVRWVPQAILPTSPLR